MKKKKIDIIKDYLFFWIDELEFTIWDIKKNVLFNKSLTWEINDTNSSDWNIIISWLKFNYFKIRPKWYSTGLRFVTTFNWEIVSCFAILKWQTSWAIKSNNKIVFYSSFFVLESLWLLPFSILEFFTNNFETLHSKLYRLDIALDLPYEIPEIKQQVFKNILFFASIWKDTKHPEFNQTYYINNPRSWNNRRFIFRIYDKVLDTFKKNKWFLYPHLQNNNNVRRIELELRAEECSRLEDFSIIDILSDSEKKPIQRIFTNYFNRFSLYQLDYKEINLTKYLDIRYDLKKMFLKLWHVPENYLARAHWWFRKIKESTWRTWLYQSILWSKLEDIYIKDYVKNYVSNTLDNQKNLTSLRAFKNDKIFTAYEMLDNMIIYMKDNNLSQPIINNILKRHIQTPKIKLKKTLKKEL